MYPLVAKVNLGDDVRRIYFDAGVERNLTWATLKQKIFDSFRKENPNLFTITYKDDEGDRVTITSDSEMSELLNYHTTLKKGTKFLYLTIHPRKDNSTPVYTDHSSELSHSSLRKSQTFKKSNSSTENAWEFKSSEPVTKKRTPSSSILSSSAHLPRSHATKPKTPSTDYDSDCSLRGTYLSDDSSPSPPNTPPSLRTKTTTTTPIRKRPLKTTKGFFNISPRATTPPKTVPKSQKEISRPRFKHPPRPARAPFDPKKRQQTTPQRFNSSEKYTELKQLAENLTHEEEKMSFVPKSDETPKSGGASKSSTNNIWFENQQSGSASGSVVASKSDTPSNSSVDNTQVPIKKNVETRSIACQTDSVLVMPAGSLENLSGELAQLLIKEIRSGGLFVPPQNASGLDVSWGPVVGRSGQYELSDADIPPQANEGQQLIAIPDRSSSNIFQTPSPPPGGPGPQQSIVQAPATSQMIDDMSRSIADLSEEMRLLRQSIVMKESQQSSSSCSRSEGSTTFSTASNSTSTSSFDNSSTPQTSSNQQTTSNNLSSTHLYQREGSTPVHAEKEGEETTQYKSFDAYFSSTSDSDPSSVSSSSTAVTQEEEERTSSLSSSASSQKQGASQPNVEMFKSTDDISRIQKEVDSTFSSKSQSIEQLLETLTTMGFTNQVFNKVILQQNNCDLEEAISDLKSFYSKSSSSV